MSCNTTLEDLHIIEEPLWKDFTFHHLGLALGAVFGLLSVIISLCLIAQHALHYSKPTEQRHIIRILFMIPVYSVVSFLSFLFYRKAIYFQVMRDCYEAFAISSFFALLCHYIAPDLHEQKMYFRTVTPQNWFWKAFWLQSCTGGENKGPFRRPRSGLTWFNVIWVGIFQYCFIRVFFTIVSVISEAFGRYCEASLHPAFAHIWTMVFESISVTIAMFMVVQFYIQLKTDLAEHKPGIKVVSIKLVIFFSFWQTIIISFLSSSKGPLQPTKQLAYQDIKIGIPSVLLIIEMALFSVLHVFAYPWKPYSKKHASKDDLTPLDSDRTEPALEYYGGFMGIRAITDAFNPWDIVTSSARGFRWLFVGSRVRHRDTSYFPTKPDLGETSYTNPSAANPAATELRPSADSHRRTGTLGEDDMAGLLRNSQSLTDNSPPRAYNHSDAPPYDHHSLRPSGPSYPGRAASPHREDGHPPPTYYPMPDSGFHPGMGPPPGSAIPVGLSGEVHPIHRGVTPTVPQGQGWNPWNGVDLGDERPQAHRRGDSWDSMKM
ncbi:unnamed protein product [Zymoseptoria tritici ST99CH_3D1]|nr:unnamed protein product [Zymoseptoria tritici ST99CH_3D1]